jgi:hypothetical protein
MKHLHRALTGITLLTLVFFGCKKEYSYEIPGGGPAGTYQWSFTEGANAYKGPVDTAFIDTLGTQKQLTISGHSSDNKEVISLQVFADTIQVGTYKTNRCSFDYLRSGVEVYRSDLTAIDQFTINITAIDSISITGTFSGIALDTAKKQKAITDGKFKARLKSVVPGTNNCKISKLVYTDSTYNVNYFSQFSLFSGNTTSSVNLSDSTGAPYTLPFPVTYSTGKVAVPINGNPNKMQYFSVDANGRATSFTGYQDPLSDTSAPMVAVYTYDAGGHMIKRTETYKPTPTTSYVLDISYTWSGNLLTQAVLKYGTAKVLQADYEYDANTTVKNFLVLHPYAAELFYFQSAVSVGVVPDKAISKVTERLYDTSGAVNGTSISYIEKYTRDANNYVKNFWVRGDDFTAMALVSGVTLFASTKYTLSYHCQ